MRSQKIFLILSIAIIIASCSGRSPAYRGRHVASSVLKEGSSTPAKARLLPWELWNFGRDLKGDPLPNISIVRGDESMRAGDRVQALDQYKTALAGPLSPSEKEAVIYRVAGIELGNDDADAALRTLSGYFQETQKMVGDVPSKFSLIFGYAFGRKGDFDQSLAWFSRAYNTSAPQFGVREGTVRAMKRVIDAIPDSRFEDEATTWADDENVAPLFSEARSRRTEAGSVVGKGESPRPFGEDLVIKKDSVKSDDSGVEIAGKVGVILPLSGEYGNLGNSIKNGIEMAIAGSGPELKTSFVYKDSKGSSVEAATQARALVDNEEVSVIIGPLLAEESVVVGDLAAQYRTPIISFSKRSDFRTGPTQFRLAPTADAQIESLVSGAFISGLRTFAMVYPDDSAGREFSEMFQRFVTQRGGTVKYSSGYPKDSPDTLLERAKEVEQIRVDGVFFPDSIARAAQFFSSIGETARKRIHPLGLANWDNSAEMLHSATVLDGALYVSPFFREGSNSTVSSFVASYRQRYEGTPDFLAAQGFDAGTLVIAALKRAGDEKRFVDAFTGIESYEGLTGKIHVDSSGEVVRQFPVIQLTDGKLDEVKSVSTSPAVPTFVD